MWRYPFGSGGNRVTTSETLASRTSAATISRMKSLRSGMAGLSALRPLLLIVSQRVVQLPGPSGRGGAPRSRQHLWLRPRGRVAAEFTTLDDTRPLPPKPRVFLVVVPHAGERDGKNREGREHAEL